MQFSTTHSGIQSYYCTAINASTDGLTLYGVTITAGKIYTVFFTKFSLALPVEVEEQTTYYLRISSSVIKIYRTLATAQTQTSPVDFATSASSGTLFLVYFPVATYPALTCWEIGAETIADIVCCPPVPEVYTNCPNAGSIVYDGATRSLKNFHYLSNGGAIPSMLGALNSEQFNVNFPHPFTAVMKTWNVSINQHFVNYRSGYYQPGLDIEIANVDYGYIHLFYQASATTFPTTTYTYAASSDGYSYANMAAAGLIPSTLSVTFSGQVVPPPQIKVYMPDAYFENKAAPITLGLVEETLTYDDTTLTYWSDLKTYAGIPGRLHFAIPNFYPLTSSGIQFVDSGIKYEYQNFGIGTTLTPLGSFPNGMLNTHSNDEFTFYSTVSCQHVLLGEIYFGESNLLRLFTARDAYDGYPTGLALGTTWFDSRIIRNVSSSSPLYTGPTFVNRTNQKMVIAFSKWASGKFLKSNQLGSELYEAAGDLNHYHQSAYFIQSVNSGAYVSSLGL
jgi:hypothetical protein